LLLLLLLLQLLLYNLPLLPLLEAAALAEPTCRLVGTLLSASGM
jgi:hypothetical protein